MLDFIVLFLTVGIPLSSALLLASLEFVDFVIMFDDDTALPLVDAIRPDVILKEGYTIDRWPEAQFVESYGGRAVTLSRLDGYSTTQTIQKMKRGEGTGQSGNL